MLQMLVGDVPSTLQEIEAELLQVRGEIEIRELWFSRLAAARGELEGTDLDRGGQTNVDWLRHNCRLTQQAAADRVHVGERLSEMPGSEDAFCNGEIGFQHLTVMARTAHAIGEGFDESKLLPLARKHSPGKFYFEAMHYRHSIQPKEVALEQADLAEKRHLSMSTADDGCLLLNGVLDPVGGAAFRTAIEALARPMGKHDHRDRPKRLADAMVELAERKLRVHMQVTSSVETLLGLIGAPGADTEFSLPISFKTVERWACDCNLTRVLMQESVPIDVGRSQRTIKGPQRRALIARDKHCGWPACERPASYCDGHHLRHWKDGGGLELDNMVLLCGRHHWMVHEGGWQLVKTEEQDLLAVAPMLTFGMAMPRAPD